MKFFFSLLLVCGLLFNPLSATAADDLDQLLSALLIGTWEEGETPYGIVTFAADGSYHMDMFDSRKKTRVLLTLEGTWEIKNSELQSVLTSSNSPKAPIGESFADRIVQINRFELILIGVDGKRYSKFRIDPK